MHESCISYFEIGACMYDSFNIHMYIHIYIYVYVYTHGKCPTRNPAKMQSINIAIPSFNIIYIIYQALWKHPSLSFKKIFGKTHWGVKMCPPISCNLPGPPGGFSASLSPLSCGDKNCKARPCLRSLAVRIKTEGKCRLLHQVQILSPHIFPKHPI